MKSGSFGRIASNAASMITSDVLNRATTFVVYVLVARYLGKHAFGQLTVGLTLFFVFYVFASAGLKILLAREVAKDRTATNQYFVSGSLVVVAFSILSFAALFGLVRLLHYSADTTLIIYMLVLGLFPASLSVVVESIMQGWERMHLIALATVPVSVGKVVACLVLLERGHGLFDVVLTLVACRCALLALEWGLLVWHICRPVLRFNLQLSRTMVRMAMPFLGIDALVTLQPAIVVLLLSKLATESEVGLYNAGAQLLVPVALVFHNVMISVFPVMCRRFNADFAHLRTLAERLLQWLLALALPAATGLFLLAKPILLLVYENEDFAGASIVLRILVGSLILTVYSHALGNVLMAGNREKVNLQIVVVDVLASLAIGVLLIGRFGLVGAAATAMIVHVINFVLHYALTARVLPGIPVVRVLWKPATASAAMAGCLAVLRLPGVWAPIAAGVAVYTAVFFVLMVWSHGGVRPLANQCLYRWSE